MIVRPFRKGGYNQSLPLMIQCPDAELADFCYSNLQPFIDSNCRTSSEFSARAFVAQEEFKLVAQRINASFSLVWAVIYGYRVGIFLDRYVESSIGTYCLLK